MEFDKRQGAESAGFFIGYALSYILFTIMLFLILRFTGKLGSWTVFHVIAITAAIALAAYLMRRWLS